jgi:steroid delta-isomerase-like uncharacterized protein
MKSIHSGAYLILAILLISGISNAQVTENNHRSTINTESKMSAIQRNKEVIRKLIEESLNKRNMGLLQELVSENFVGAQGEKGPAGLEEAIGELIKAVPDIQWKIEDLLGEEDKVVVRWKWRGTQTGQFKNLAATGKSITNTAIAIFELKDGKIINAQLQTDRLGFLQELDVLPLDLSLLSNRKTAKDQVRFIDKFFVPASAKNEFYERVSINRNFIKNLPGFIEDAAYEYTDKDGNLICITVAVWENMQALNKAREAVQAEYKKQGFDTAEFIKRFNIVADRGIYTELKGR